MSWLLVALGAAVGAPLRYLTDRFVQARHSSRFPWGTFAANMAGCAILGAIAGTSTAPHVSHELQLLIGTGFCGALTTYSTFSYETLLLAQRGARLLAVANVVASVATGLGAVYLGAAITA